MTKLWEDRRPRGLGRPSPYTEDEMQILAEAVRLHLLSPKASPLKTIADRYGVPRTALVRIKKNLEADQPAFLVRPTSVKRVPFSNRGPDAPDPKLESQGLSDAEIDARVEKLASTNDRGARRRLLLDIALRSHSATERVRALEAERKLADADQEAHKIGPPPPDTVFQKIDRVVDILHCAGIEVTVAAVQKAWGEAIKIHRTRGSVATETMAARVQAAE